MPTLKSSKTPSNFQSTNSCSNSIYFSFTASHELQFRICRAAAEVHKSPQNAMRRHYKCYASVVKMLIECWHWENMIRKKWPLIDPYVCLIFSIKLNMSYVRCGLKLPSSGYLKYEFLLHNNHNYESLESVFFSQRQTVFYILLMIFHIYLCKYFLQTFKMAFFKRYPVYNDAR